MKLGFIVIFFIVGSCNLYYPQAERTELNDLEVGEELTYVVKYSFVKLGEINFKIIAEEKKGDHLFYRTTADIKSYPGIPFVDLHQIFTSFYNENNYSDFFRTIDIRDKVYFTDYDIDYKKNIISVKKGSFDPYNLRVDSSLTFEGRVQDGLSIFYTARLLSGSESKDTLNSFIEEKFGNTYINFTDEIYPVEIDVFDEKIETVRLSGKVGFEGIFGLTGDFEGWFSNDRYAVPIVAKLNVIIGKVTVELINWNKNIWNPPVYNHENN